MYSKKMTYLLLFAISFSSITSATLAYAKDTPSKKGEHGWKKYQQETVNIHVKPDVLLKKALNAICKDNKILELPVNPESNLKYTLKIIKPPREIESKLLVVTPPNPDQYTLIIIDPEKKPHYVLDWMKR